MSWEPFASGILSTVIKTFLEKAFQEVYAMLDFLINFAISFFLGYILFKDVSIKTLLLFSTIIALINSLFIALVAWYKNNEVGKIKEKLSQIEEENKKLAEDNNKLSEENNKLKEDKTIIASDLEKCKHNLDWVEKIYKMELENTQKRCQRDVWRINNEWLEHIVHNFCRSNHIGRAKSQSFGIVDVYLVDTQLGQRVFIVPKEIPSETDVSSFINSFWDIASITQGKTKDEILDIVQNL